MAVVSTLSRLLGLAPAQIVGTLDRPGPRQPYGSSLPVAGWAISTDGAPVEIVVEADGREVAAVTPATPRPDVAGLYAQVESAATSGFEVDVRADALPDVPEATLVVKARRRGSTGGHEIGRCVITRHAGASQGTARSAYGLVWDDVAQTEGAARISVCGTDDGDEWARSGEATAADVRELAEVTRQDDVLEIGCGAGRVGRFLAPHCRSWTGADVSPNMLRFAAEALAGQANVSTVRLNGYDLGGVADGSRDVVYCTGVFMHLDEWERFRYVKDARRVLRPGGRLYVDNFNLLEPEGWALFLEHVAMDPAARPPNISRHSTPQELDAYVRHAGFADVRVRTGGLWVTVTGRVATAT
jgi:SAM-dependent methyltransferase